MRTRLICTAALAASLLGAAPVGAQPIGAPQMSIIPRTHPGTAFAGLTRLGDTPLTVTLPAGAVPLTVFGAGLYPAQRIARLRAGARITWQPILKPPMPPGPSDWPADGPGWLRTRCVGRCGLGASAHFSAPLAQALAVARAVVEATRGQSVQIAGLGHTYDETRGVGRKLTTRQETDTVITLGAVQIWRGAGLSAARVALGTRAAVVSALGAGDALGDASDAAAQLGALVSALRWWAASAPRGPGVRVQAVSRTWGDDMLEAAAIEDTRALTVEGEAVAGVHLTGRLRDEQSLARRTDGDRPVRTRDADEIALTAGPLRVWVADGVAVRLEGAADAAAALDQLSAAVAAAGLSVTFAQAAVDAPVPVWWATLRP